MPMPARTRLCASPSVSTLTRLVAYAPAGWTWIDPAAGFVSPPSLKEGREAREGELVCNDDDDP